MSNARHRRPPARTSSKAATTTLGLLVSSAVLMGSTVAAEAEPTPTVSLTVNGQTKSVTTTASTVAGLLNRRSINYDANDLLSPGPGADIVDGLDITLRRNVQLTIVDDGARSHRVISAHTVRAARNELKLPTAPTYRTSSTDKRKFERTLIYAPNGARLHANDHVREDSVARVHDIRLAFPAGDYRVDHRVVKDRTNLVRKGSSKVVRQGHDGRKHIVWRKRFVDGTLASRTVARSQWERHAQSRMVKVGTGPNWIALGRCESGNNPNAVNPAGFYGLYQFSLSTWHSVGGRGNPTDHNYWEQTKRAWILFKSSGRSPWPVCGRYL